VYGGREGEWMGVLGVWREGGREILFELMFSYEWMRGRERVGRGSE